MVIKQTIGIDGMHCAACSARAEKALSQLQGMITCSVNLALEEASVEYDDRKLNINTINRTIMQIGYTVRQDSIRSDDDQLREVLNARNRMIAVWIITALVIVFMLPHMLMGKMLVSHGFDSWTMFALSIIAMAFPARKVYLSAWRSIISGSANMDVLIALGTISALAVQPLSLFFKELPVHAFSGIPAMILAFHLTGRFLELQARGKASEAIRKLLNLGVKTALVIRDDMEVEVPLHKIQVGDIMLVKPGAKIPTDGVVLEGISNVDESMATGEAMPVSRKTGDSVIGATLNLDGVLYIKATKIGSDTFLAQVIKLVQEAQHSKVPVQILADKVTAIFVPIILITALMTFLLWQFKPDWMNYIYNYLHTFLPGIGVAPGNISFALMTSIAVLVIACPCALGLATPTALMVGSGMGAVRGILIRNGEALQRMKDVKVVVFDKTGTLTYGKPDLLEIFSLGMPKLELLSIAASLESGSEHPLAKAIVNAAKNQNLHLVTPEDFIAFSGLGLSANIEQSKYYLGSLDFLKQQNVGLPLSLNALPLDDYPEASRVYVANDSGVLGCLLVADKLRIETTQVVKHLKAMQIKPVMLSGDSRHVARSIASKCGIEHVVADVLPKDKAIEVRNLQTQFGVVAMIGDGINDAPALKQADIGIAMGQGTDVAIEAADITILRNDLNSLITAINLSNATFSKIKQNLFWAFFYNLIAIPLAIFGMLHPVVAESAMAISSLTVVTNANLLKRAKIDLTEKV